MATQKETVDDHVVQIRDHDRLLVLLGERVDRIRDDLVRIEKDQKDLSARLQKMEVQAAEAARDSTRLEKRVDEFTTHRFEILKLVLTATLGGLITLLAGLALRALERPNVTAPPAAVQPNP